MDRHSIPTHIAIIMDGNGRWAKKRGLPRIAGHRAGVRAVREAIEAAGELGVKVLTLYAFSTENWKRPRAEVGALFGLLEDHITREAETLKKNGIRLVITGDMEALPAGIRQKLSGVIEATSGNSKLILNIALNYGSRQEMLSAVKRAAQDVKDGRLRTSDIDERVFAGYLYTRDLPDPDLMIRTSGEMRISNFLLWQISYAELYFTKKFWPDFRKADLKKAVSEYQKRERRYGG